MCDLQEIGLNDEAVEVAAQLFVFLFKPRNDVEPGGEEGADGDEDVECIVGREARPGDADDERGDDGGEVDGDGSDRLVVEGRLCVCSCVHGASVRVLGGCIEEGVGKRQKEKRERDRPCMAHFPLSWVDLYVGRASHKPVHSSKSRSCRVSVVISVGTGS